MAVSHDDSWTRPPPLPWTALAWAMALGFAAFLLALAVQGRADALLIGSAFALPLALLLLLPLGLPAMIVAAGSFVLVLSGLGWALDWYGALWWFDLLIHGLNPLVLTTGSFLMLWKAGLPPAPGRGRLLLWGALYGLALGVGWELIELTFLVLTWDDTLSDLAMDVVGAALGGAWAGRLVARGAVRQVGRRRLRRAG